MRRHHGLAGGSTVDVPTMAGGLQQLRCAEGSGWKAVELPYAGGSLAMTIVVPDDLAAFVQHLDATRFGQITGALAAREVELWLPRFAIRAETDLAGTLSALGMPLAFDPQLADFSGIAGEERLHVSAVVHRANISVDEKGTEAAAATAVAMAATAMPADSVTLRVDRPFLFAVRDLPTGAILSSAR
jgi:serpin B